jgi:hypothetical protein
MNRFFRMYGAKLVFAVVALLLFAGVPEFGERGVEARPKRRAAVKRVKGATKRYGRTARSRGGKGRAVRVRTRGGRTYARSVRRGGGRASYARGGRTIRYVRVRGKRGRYRRVVVSARRGGGRFYGRRSVVAASRTPVATFSEPRAPRPVRSVQIPEDRAREIQAALKGAGFYQGEVTGQYDEGTREAMRNYQRANGLKETGTPTAPALLKLGLTRHSSPAGDTSAPSVVPQTPNPQDKPNDDNPQ